MQSPFAVGTLLCGVFVSVKSLLCRLPDYYLPTWLLLLIELFCWWVGGICMIVRVYACVAKVVHCTVRTVAFSSSSKQQPRESVPSFSTGTITTAIRWFDVIIIHSELRFLGFDFMFRFHWRSRTAYSKTKTFPVLRCIIYHLSSIIDQLSTIIYQPSSIISS